MSKYLEAFKKLKEYNPQLMELDGECLLVEEIQEEEFKTNSGLILSTGDKQINSFAADRPVFLRVLYVGDGFIDEDIDVPLETNPGDIVLVGKHSVKYFSVFGKLISYGDTKLGLIKESEIQVRFKGEGNFDKAFEYLNNTIKSVE